MTDSERREFWWNTVTGPRAVVLDACTALRDGCGVLLKGGADAAWPTDMRNAIESTFKEQMSTEEVLLQVLDAAEGETPADIGRRLLDMFGSPRQRSGYRTRSRTSVQEYLVKNGILRQRLLWVRLEDPEACAAWQAFVRAYPGRGVADGLFVLAVAADARCEEGARLRRIDLGERIGVGDLKLLNTFVLGNRFGYSAAWREYASGVAAAVLFPDAALSAELVEAADLRSSTIREALAVLDERYADLSFAPNHALSLFRRGDSGGLEHRMWQAQIRTLFPWIEMERVDIVNKWRPNIERGLRETSLEQFGERVERPEDVELGLLRYCMTHWKPDGEYVMYLPDRFVRDRVHFLHRCRNKLAHLSAIDREELVELLDGSPELR